jgi:protein-disulfide isomerase
MNLLGARWSRLSGLAWFAAAAAIASSAGCHDSQAGSSGASSATAPSASGAPEVKDIVLAGVDTSAMTPRERHSWSAIVSSVLSPCPDVPVPVAQCVQEKRACSTCVQAAKWVARAVRAGASEGTIERAYRDRFDPSTVRTFPNDGSPTRGPDDAPVTIVEFADFECPHCAAAVSLIDAVMQVHPGKVRLVYKPFTLSFHLRGEPAARSALAAGVQGKFWEMEHLLFERQQHLEDADLERYAQMLKLDVARWKADMSSAAVSDVIAKEHKLGEDINIKGTPTIFINGRELDTENDESLEERVAAELGVPPITAVAPDDRSSEATPPGSASAHHP